jgi:hypothetical protein
VALTGMEGRGVLAGKLRRKCENPLMSTGKYSTIMEQDSSMAGQFGAMYTAEFSTWEEWRELMRCTGTTLLYKSLQS